MLAILLCVLAGASVQRFVRTVPFAETDVRTGELIYHWQGMQWFWLLAASAAFVGFPVAVFRGLHAIQQATKSKPRGFPLD